jgi:hypothetical protein
MPRLNTVGELKLKKKLSKERVRRLQKDIMREKEKQKKFDAKMKMAPRD